MPILGGVAKDAGTTATHELHQAVDGAINTLNTETIARVEQSAQRLGDSAADRISALVADIAARLHGANLPIDVTLTLRITGKIGDVHLSEPQRMEVKG